MKYGQKQPLIKDVFKVQQLFVEVYNKKLRTILGRGWWGEGTQGRVCPHKEEGQVSLWVVLYLAGKNTEV